jgi:hypothetical protein
MKRCVVAPSHTSPDIRGEDPFDPPSFELVPKPSAAGGSPKNLTPIGVTFPPGSFGLVQFEWFAAACNALGEGHRGWRTLNYSFPARSRSIKRDYLIGSATPRTFGVSRVDHGGRRSDRSPNHSNVLGAAKLDRNGPAFDAAPPQW